MADGYWDHWFYIHPWNLFHDVTHSFEKTRACRQFDMQLCLPWAPNWFAPKSLGCNFAERLTIRTGQLTLVLYSLLYGGLGFLTAWALQKSAMFRLQLWRPLEVLMFAAICCWPWGLVNLIWEYKHNHICWNPPSFQCVKKL